MIRRQGKNAWVDQIMHALQNHQYDLLVVPSQTARSAIVGRIGAGLIPRIVTYDRPLGYQESLFVSGVCIGKPQALSWIMTFLSEKSAQGLFLKDSTVRDLSLSFWMMWEHIERYHKDWSLLIEYDGVFLGEKEKTIHLLKDWALWWPQWLRSKRGISRSAFEEQSRHHALELWASWGKKKRILCVVDPVFFMIGHDIESWLKKVCALPGVQSITVPLSSHCIHQKNAHIERTECQTVQDKARIIALSIAKSIFLGRSVALHTKSSALLQSVDFFLKKWGLSLSGVRDLSVVSLLKMLLQCVWGGCSMERALDILYHPLTRRFYPISSQMGAWLQRHCSAINSTNFEQWVEWSHDSPRWAKRALRHMRLSIATLSSWMKNNQSMDVSHWLRAHVAALNCFVPDVQKDAVIMEYLLKIMQTLTMKSVITFRVYKIWFDAVCDTEHVYTKNALSIPLIFQVKDMRWLDCDDCIDDGDDDQDQTLSWLPRSLQQDLDLVKRQESAMCHAWGSHLSCALHVLRLCVDAKPSLYHQWFGVWAKMDNHQIDHDQKDGMSLETKRFIPLLKKVSVSDIQAWIKDPDLFYKERILKIQPVGMSAFQKRGLLLHRILDAFITQYPPSETMSLDEMTHHLIQMTAVMKQAMPWWKESWIDHLCASIARCEYDMRQEQVYTSVTECYGYWEMRYNDQNIRLTARADRIDIFPDGTARIIDYKTGTVPSYVSMDRLESVQLPLEGWMAQKNAFCTGAIHVTQLCYWHLSLSKGCIVKSYPRSVKKLIEKYDEILPIWMQQFAQGAYGHGPAA